MTKGLEEFTKELKRLDKIKGPRKPFSKKNKKQSAGPAGMTIEEFKKSKKNKKGAGPQTRNLIKKLENLFLTKEMIDDQKVVPLKKGGEVKKKKNKMATTKGWGASRKT